MGVTVKHKLSIGKLGPRITKGLPKALDKVSVVLMKQINRNLSGGVLNVRTGRLRANVEQQIIDTKQGSALEIGVKLSTVPYARIHELGGFAGRGRSVKIPKRPYLRKALAQKKKRIRTIMRKFVTKLVRKR